MWIKTRITTLMCRLPNPQLHAPQLHAGIPEKHQAKQIKCTLPRLRSSSPQVEVAVSTLYEFFKPLPFEKDPKICLHILMGKADGVWQPSPLWLIKGILKGILNVIKLLIKLDQANSNYHYK